MIDGTIEALLNGGYVQHLPDCDTQAGTWTIMRPHGNTCTCGLATHLAALREPGEPEKVHDSIVRDLPGRPVAAPCVLSGCHYASPLSGEVRVLIAATALRNEVQGWLGAFDSGLRQLVGHTNVEVMRTKLNDLSALVDRSSTTNHPTSDTGKRN